MFQHCTSLNKITGLENWDISNVEKMDNFLNGCTELKEANGLEKWKLTDKLEEAKTMFGYCSNLVIDLSNWTIDRSKINAINMCLRAIKMKKPKFINK
jgi:surface protein